MAMSNGERKIAALLDRGEVDYEQEYSFIDLKSTKGHPLRFDFAVFDSPESVRPAFLIEYQGAQHYEKRFQTSEGFARQQANDKKKRSYCSAKGIPLVEVPYTEYNALTLDWLLEQGKFFD